MHSLDDLKTSLWTNSLSIIATDYETKAMPQQPTGRAPQEIVDLLGDGPSFTTIAGNIEVDKDLTGTEDLTSRITSDTGELASMQNQITSLTAVTGDLQSRRAALERNLSVLSAQKQDTSIRLNQVKTLHESERNSIKELESTLSSIQPQLIQLRAELEVSERELSTIRAQRDEFLLSLTRDQEESNQIKTRMSQNHEETVKLREELEARKKDTTRQKGLLDIARRQLAATEADKQRLVNEIAQESERARGTRQLSTTASPVPSSGTIAPPPPAPRGSRKEPPAPPASRGTAITTISSSAPELEDAFGIPEALRSPTGSFGSVHSPRMNASTAISRQSTGSSPFDSIPRQGTGSSPFESIPKQGTGSSPFETIPRQGTGTSARAPSITSDGAKDQDDFWSQVSANTAGQPEVSIFPDPEVHLPHQQESTLALAAGQALPRSPHVSQDPFASFPAMDTPPVTKMDFDAAFQGLSTSKPSQSNALDGVQSAEAFAEAFPDLDAVEGFGVSRSNRVSAFGFEDDFSGVSPFTHTLDKKSKEDDEFPPIIEMTREEGDSSDSDDGNGQPFVQAHSSIASPEPSSTPIPVEALSVTAAAVSAITSQVEDETLTTPTTVLAVRSAAIAEPTASTVTPVPVGSSTRALTDFSEFETFGEPTDDFELDFKGVELAAPRVSGGVGAGTSIAGFEDIDFSTTFDEAFGSSPFGGSSLTSNTKPTPSSAIGASEMDKAFGVSTSTVSPATSTKIGAGSNGFGQSFEEDFFFTAPAPSVPVVAPSPRAVPPTPVPASATTPAATPVPAVPEGLIDKLMIMGCTREKAKDALIRYDLDIERAANYLAEQ